MVVAGMPFLVVVAGMALLVMVVAVGSCVHQLAPQIGRHGLVRAAGCPGAEGDALLLQGGLSAAADAAADQHVDALFCQQTGQGAVAAAVGRKKPGGEELPVLDLIELEGLRVSEVLEHLAVVIGDGDFLNRHSYDPPVDILNISIPQGG